MFAVLFLLSVDAQTHQHEEITELSPSTMHQTTTYGSGRISDSSELLACLSKFSSGISPYASCGMTSTEQQFDENYEVTISSSYDESGLRIFPSKPITTSSETGEQYV